MGGAPPRRGGTSGLRRARFCGRQPDQLPERECALRTLQLAQRAGSRAILATSLPGAPARSLMSLFDHINMTVAAAQILARIGAQHSHSGRPDDRRRMRADEAPGADSALGSEAYAQGGAERPALAFHDQFVQVVWRGRRDSCNQVSQTVHISQRAHPGIARVDQSSVPTGHTEHRARRWARGCCSATVATVIRRGGSWLR